MNRLQNFLTARLLLLLVALLMLFFLSTPAEARLFANSNNDDLYARLGVGRGATKDEIKKAFRKITREHHPDMQETQEAKEAAKEYMVKVLQAYKVLSDDIQRQDYDAFGKIPGEAFDSASFTAQEIFEYFHQQSPILSKTHQLESLSVLQRILNFRGNRLFLLQVYDDSCKSCRWFASTWEGLTQSSLVEGLVVEMFRIDAYSMEGPQLLEALGISYKGEIGIYAIIDGKKWAMPHLKTVVSSRSGRNAFTSLLDFVMSFFYDKYIEINSLKVGNNNTQDILEWLQEERGSADAVRVLLPPLTVESIALTLSYKYEGVAVVRSVSREALIDFVENHCEQTVEMRGRDGEVIPTPEFIVVSLQQLTRVAEMTSKSIGESKVVMNCSRINVGVSATLSYRKAESFLSDALPQRHPGMANMKYVTGMSLYELCRRHCLLWLRESCVKPPSDNWKNALQGNYKPFSVGYLCLDSEAGLREALATSTPDTLVAIVDGDEYNLHFLLPEPEPSQIARALSNLLSEEQETTPLRLTTPLSLLMTSKPFHLSYMQYFYINSRWIYSLIYPFFSNSYPFLMMFIMHKLLNRFNLLGNNNNNNNSSSSSNSNSTTRNGGATASTTSTATANNGGNRHGSATNSRTNKKEVSLLTAADLEAAKDAKGFLLLFFQNGKEEMPALPPITEDSRFTVRLVSPTDPRWDSWLSEQKPQGEETSKGEGSSTEAKEPTVVAIRQGKMKATVKPPNAAMDSWLCDLLDGTITATAPLP
ncbi:putative DnaJ chaperone protein [Trypanosoma cruzi]|uniref:DnaJ chaperone protein, putative n=2 Tax=Trypanosoma cruzi TaxID=5693 RepID=Q4D3G9_TRYCC|nr:DnaJ chaperone protein, putative [Trypanosoma cruzi]EAN87068.1 DnaJ chaperone protein, putative [Trypanosoma cruzi]PWV10429.1 putative DnaJ chaperone protein [Trypanosoma cruzi]RNC58113.1 putative chaperone DNAJ protein [Trypanosoma cruzi]|eukprot:XP_808919.1 DnaJ chaperone protein [Trypanosoma cruzi strain CL Brener]